jgi:hypothetical protein
MKTSKVLAALVTMTALASFAQANDTEIVQQMAAPGGLIGQYHLITGYAGCTKNIEIKVNYNPDSRKDSPVYELSVANMDVVQTGYDFDRNLLVVTNMTYSRRGGNDIDTETFDRSATPTSIENSWKDKTGLFFGPSKEASLKLSGKGTDEFLLYKYRSSSSPASDPAVNYDVKCAYKRN